MKLTKIADYKIGDTGAHQHHRLDQVYQEISFLLGFLMVKHKYFTLDFLKRNHEKKTTVDSPNGGFPKK